MDNLPERIIWLIVVLIVGSFGEFLGKEKAMKSACIHPQATAWEGMPAGTTTVEATAWECGHKRVPVYKVVNQ